MPKLCLFAYIYKRLFSSTAVFFFSRCFCGLKKINRTVNRLRKLAFMFGSSLHSKKIINYLSWWLIAGSEWLDNYIVSSNRVQMHAVLLWENLRIFPTFAYINQYVNALLLLAKVTSIGVLSMDVRVCMLYFIR